MRSVYDIHSYVAICASMAQAVAEDFKSSLLDLSFNSRPHISMLTMLAEENIKHASSIVDTIVNHIMKVHPSLKLPCLYLVDSIMKNVGEQYLTLFSHHMINLFSAVFEKVDEITRSLLFKLRQTWTGILVDELLYKLDLKIKELDPAWPITANYSDDSEINLLNVNSDTTKEEDSNSSKHIELEEDRNIKSKKDMLNQLVQKHKILQLNKKKSKTHSKLKQVDEVPFNRLDTCDFQVSTKDMELHGQDKSFHHHVTREAGVSNPDQEKDISVTTLEFPFQHPEHLLQVSEIKCNSHVTLKDISKNKTRNEVVITKSSHSLFKKKSRRKHSKLAFSEWEQTRKDLPLKSNENSSKNSCEEFPNNGKKEYLNNGSDYKLICDSKSENQNLKENLLVGKERTSESFHNENISITDNQTILDETDSNVSDSSKFIELVSKRTEVNFTSKLPKDPSVVLSTKICNKEKIDMLVDEEVSVKETIENEINTPSIVPKESECFEENVRESKPIDTNESVDIVASMNENISKIPIKRDFRNIEGILTENEVPEKIRRLESTISDQFSAENNQELFGSQDKDLRRLTEHEFKGWDQYKKAHPEEFESPQMARKSLEGKLRSRKFSTESNSSCEDTLSLQLFREMYQTAFDKDKGFHMREMVKSNDHKTAEPIYFDPYLFIQKAEECFRKGKVSQNKYLELCQDLNKMMYSHFRNIETTEESQSQILESATGMPSSSSKENCPLPSKSMLTKDSLVLQDARKFILDGKMRTIHFIEKKAFIILDNGEPRELTFQGKDKSVHIDGLPNPILLNFDGKPAEFHINGKRHTICLGTPARELYIDNHPYEIKFGGPPLIVDFGNGQFRKIFASGPPPQVIIGNEPSFDILNEFRKNIEETQDIKFQEKMESFEELKNLSCENKDFKDVDMRQKPIEMHSQQNSDSESLKDVDWRQAKIDKNLPHNDKSNILQPEPRDITSCAPITASETKSENQENFQYQRLQVPDVNQGRILNEQKHEKYLTLVPTASSQKLEENQEIFACQEEKSWNLESSRDPSTNSNLDRNTEMHFNYPAVDDRGNIKFYPHWNDSKYPEKQQLRERRYSEFREPHSFPSFPPPNEHPDQHQAYNKEFQDSRYHHYQNIPRSNHEDQGYSNPNIKSRSFCRTFNRRSARSPKYGFRGSWRGRDWMNTRFDHQQNQRPHKPATDLAPQLHSSFITSNFALRQPRFEKPYGRQVPIKEDTVNSKVPDMDIESLMKKLLAAGIINSKPEELKSTSDTNESQKSDNKSEQDSHESEENMPPILFKSENLKVCNITVISALHKGIQCESCGLRFNNFKKEIYSRHLDWHFRMNRRGKSGLKKPSLKHWFYEIQDWIQFEEFDEPDEKSKTFLKLLPENNQDDLKVPIPSVPATKSDTEVCAVCNEPFQLVWMENEEEWHLHNSVCHEEEIFHPACLEDFKKEAESKVDKGSDSEESLPLKSDTLCHDDDFSTDDEIAKYLDILIDQILANEDTLDETDKSLLICSTTYMEIGDEDQELVLNQSTSDVEMAETLDAFSENKTDLNPVKQDLDILEGKPGEEEIIGVITEPESESDNELPTEDSKMVIMHSGGITLKVKAERLKQTPSPIGINSSNISVDGHQESDDGFRPPTPDPRFQVLPIVKKGRELSGLCTII